MPHRATYDMKLSVARPNSGIVEVNGDMVLETVDSCDGWEVKQRIKLKFLRNDGEEFDTDSSFTSYETKDGLGLRFSVRNIQDDEVEEELRGQADLEATGGKGRARFTLPEVAQLRAAGRHAVPDHPSRPHHPARPRRRQIGVLQACSTAPGSTAPSRSMR